MKRAWTLCAGLLLLALLCPCGALAAPIITGDFQESCELLNSAQGDDGSYTQMYRAGDVSVFCGREETFYELEDALDEKLSSWYSDVEKPDSVVDTMVDGIDAKRAKLTLKRGDTAKQVDFFCMRDRDWLVFLEFTCPADQTEKFQPQLDDWIASLRLEEGDVNASDLDWNEVSMYLDVAGGVTFPTLGDLESWLSPVSYSWKNGNDGTILTLNTKGGSVTVLVAGGEKALSGETQSVDALPEDARNLSYALRQLVWTSRESRFDPPRGFYPGSDIQLILDSFPDAMIQMVSNSQFGYTQCIELSCRNPQDASQHSVLTFYCADASVGQVVLDIK